MIGRKRAGEERVGETPAEPAALRRERDALEKLRVEVGSRLDDVKRREAALERRLAQADGLEAEPGPEILAALEERSLDLDWREQEVAAREAALADRERLLADREAIVDDPAERDRVMADIQRRQEELGQAEQLFLRTRQELVERSEAIASREEELLLWERELAAGGANPGVFLPPVEDEDDDEPRSVQRPAAQGFSSGLRELQHRGARRRTRPR